LESRTLNLTQSFDLETWSALGLSEIEAALNQWIPVDAPANLSEPMKYAVLGGGKRLRSLLVLGAFDAGIRDQDLNERGWRREAALRGACAIELIHAYSLVHDDMPCMDNDVLRRGKPTVHVQFGEATALLTGDTLQALAFEVLTPENTLIPADLQLKLCALIARAAGHNGMAGGQAIDLASVGKRLNEAELSHMHNLKTGALLEASVIAGALCAGVSEHALEKLKIFGSALGLAFQVVDDILDVTADSAVLGKTAGKDANTDKPTYVSLMGLDAAKHKADVLLVQANQALFDSDLSSSDALVAIALKIVNRRY
jgi:farnesyl diphosphate synthase